MALTVMSTVALVMFCAAFALAGTIMAVHDLLPVPTEHRPLAERAAQAVRETVTALPTQTRAARAPARRAARPHLPAVHPFTRPGTSLLGGTRTVSPR